MTDSERLLIEFEELSDSQKKLVVDFVMFLNKRFDPGLDDRGDITYIP